MLLRVMQLQDILNISDEIDDGLFIEIDETDDNLDELDEVQFFETDEMFDINNQYIIIIQHMMLENQYIEKDEIDQLEPVVEKDEIDWIDDV